MSNLPFGLTLVATPIGNASDITLRALEAFKQADLIACEDTRVTSKLFHIYGIKAKTLSYHDHNAEAQRPVIMRALQEGQRVLLVSDAGTPLISDPGYKLVQACIAENIPVTTLPGASSVMAALCLAGLPTDRFFFAGFLPPKTAAREQELMQYREIPASLVFFESASRLAGSLASMNRVLGDRQAAVTRELTKLHEEVRRGPLSELAAHYEEAGPPKGEIVLVIGPPLKEAAVSADSLDSILEETFTHHTRLRDAVDEAAARSGLPRKEVYARALELKARAGE